MPQSLMYKGLQRFKNTENTKNTALNLVYKPAPCSGAKPPAKYVYAVLVFGSLCAPHI